MDTPWSQGPSPDVGVVLVHGGGRGSWSWERVLPLVDAPTAAVDLPGRGDPAALRSVTLDACRDAVEAVIAYQGFERWILVGHSLGGLTALEVASAAPHRCLGLVLVASAVPPPGKGLQDLTPRPARWWLARAARTQRVASTPQWLARWLFCNGMDPETRRSFLARLGPESPALRAAPVAAPPTSVPVTYLRLTRDRAVPPSRQREVATRLDATVVDIHAGHEAPLTAPHNVAAAVNAVIARSTS